MTTENTAAGIRILTKTIRKLTERLAFADAAIDQKQKVINDRANEIDAARVVLDPPTGRMPTWERMVMADPLCKLAEKRMAELAELRQELANQGMAERVMRGQWQAMEERIEKALGALEGNGSAVARVHAARRILRGEA